LILDAPKSIISLSCWKDFRSIILESKVLKIVVNILIKVSIAYLQFEELGNKPNYHLEEDYGKSIWNHGSK